MITRFYSTKMAVAIKMSLEAKFPDIKDLVVHNHDWRNYTVSFANDGIHTEQEVNKFLQELKDICLNFEADQVTKL